MALIKWLNRSKKWETFFYGYYSRMTKDLKNIIKAINNTKKALVMRTRLKNNLGDLYNATEARKNIGLIGDADSYSLAPHSHQSNFDEKFQDFQDANNNAWNTLHSKAHSLKPKTCTGVPDGGKPHPDGGKPLPGSGPWSYDGLFNFHNSSNQWTGIAVLAGPFVLSEPATATITTTVNGNMHASTSPGWCRSGFGFKVTEERFLSNNTLGSKETFLAGDRAGEVCGSAWKRVEYTYRGESGQIWTSYKDVRYPAQYGAFKWTSPENLAYDPQPDTSKWDMQFFNGRHITGSNRLNISETRTATVNVPAGTWYICLYGVSQASKGDSADLCIYNASVKIG